jgi:hypothetical protein
LLQLRQLLAEQGQGFGVGVSDTDRATLFAGLFDQFTQLLADFGRPRLVIEEDMPASSLSWRRWCPNRE